MLKGRKMESPHFKRNVVNEVQSLTNDKQLIARAHAAHKRSTLKGILAEARAGAGVADIHAPVKNLRELQNAS